MVVVLQVSNWYNKFPEASAPKQIAVARNADGQIISRTVEIEGVDEDGFAYTETKRIAVDPSTGKDIDGPVKVSQYASSNANKNKIEYEGGAQPSNSFEDDEDPYADLTDEYLNT